MANLNTVKIGAQVLGRGMKKFFGSATTSAASIFNRGKNKINSNITNRFIKRSMTGPKVMPVSKFKPNSTRRMQARLTTLNNRARGKSIVKGGPNMMRAVGTTAAWGSVALGGAAMLSAGIMKGAMGESRQILYERYMQDTRYSRNMIQNARLGNAMGSRFDSYGSTMGLSNALSATRHGR
jgi:hypothetical protein